MTENEDVKRLNALLDEERDAFLKGKLSDAADLLEAKENLVDQLNANPTASAEELEGLGVKMTRNQEIMSTALDGIRAVAQRLEQLRQVRSSLDTYDARGKRQSVSPLPERTMEKRA